MRILSKRKVNSILVMLTALQVMVNNWDKDDVEFLQKATEAIVNITYDVGGTDGVNKVKRSVWKWGGGVNDERRTD